MKDCCTTIQLQKPILDAWGALGLSPLRFVKVKIATPIQKNSEDTKLESGENENKTDKLPELVFDSKIELFDIYSLKKAKLSFWFVLLLFFSICIFSIVRLTQLFHDKKHETAVVFASLCWCIHLVSCCLIFCVYLRRSKDICEFLWQWQLVEGHILTDFKLTGRNYSGSSIQMGNKVYPEDPSYLIRSQVLRFKLFLAVVSGTLGLMYLNITLFPRFPMYLYSLLPPGEDICWAKAISTIFSMTIVTLFLLCEGQLEVLFTTFAKSVSNSLQILTFPAKMWKPCQCFDEATQRTSHSADCKSIHTLNLLNESIEKYEKLEALVKSFNKIFAYPLCMYKGFTMMRLCCYVYVILKHTKNSSLFGVLVFPYAFLALVSKLGIILSSLGALPMQTRSFLKHWRKVVLHASGNSNSIHERRLNTCSNFGFLCGKFYVVYPNTILTFFSVTLTYLIILLQL